MPLGTHAQLFGDGNFVKRLTRGDVWAVLYCTACALLFAAPLFRGSPVLRHDWILPFKDIQSAIDNVTGWSPVGLGEPIGYPSSFLVVPLMGLISSLVGQHVCTVLIIFAIALLITLSTYLCAHRLHAPIIARYAVAAFALFNPWTYNKFVAGHYFMLLSYGGIILLCAELAAERPRRAAVAVCAMLCILVQIQFFVIATPVILISARMLRSWRLMLAWAAVCLPIAVGVIATRTALLAIPFNLFWEHMQSIEPSRGTILLGYFANYGSAFEGAIPRLALWAIVAIAAIGGAMLIVERQSRGWIVIIVGVLLMTSFAYRGAASNEVGFLFAHVRIMGLVRELYDLLGLVAIGYVLLIIEATVRWKGLSYIALISSICLVVVSATNAPSRYWVFFNELPHNNQTFTADTRFATIPGFQPLSFHGRGSGINPEAVPRDNNVEPLNELFPLYPINVALATFEASGNTADLGALSVSRLVYMPWLAEERRLQSGALAFPLKRAVSIGHMPSTIPYMPELTLSAVPSIGTLDNNLGAGNVFFGDAAAARGDFVPASWRELRPIVPVVASDSIVDASAGWTDARLAFSSLPDLGQAFGGAVTTNTKALLNVTGGMDALVWVRGRLENGVTGQTLLVASGGYRWIALPPDTSTVRCVGLCLVAAQGLPPSDAPLNPQPKPYASVSFKALTPWLASASVPAGGTGMLRYNVVYDPHWMAIMDGRVLAHVRVDAYENGFLVGPRNQPAPLIIVEVGALFTTVAEGIAVVVLALVLFWEVRDAVSQESTSKPTTQTVQFTSQNE